MTDEVWLEDVLRPALQNGEDVTIELQPGDNYGFAICVNGDRLEPAENWERALKRLSFRVKNPGEDWVNR